MKDIKNYEGVYAITEDGKVWSYSRRKFLTQANSAGYCQVSLCRYGEKRNYFVHRLVADAYLSNPKGLVYVRHKDGNKQNNSVKNLEWYSRDLSKTTEKRSKAVYCIELNKTFSSLTEASMFIGSAYTNLSACLNGRNKTFGGYHWKYV